MSTSEIAKLESRWRENRQGLSFAPLAEAYRKMGDPRRALEVLGEGLAVNPDYIPASIVLGRCHLDLSDDANAATAFQHVLDLDGENVIALRSLADIAERGGRIAEARERLASLLAVDRGNDDARAQLARLDSAQDAVDSDGAEAGQAHVADEAITASEQQGHGTVTGAGDLAESWDDEPSDGEALETAASADSANPAEPADADDDWIPDPEPFTPEPVEQDESIQLQEHLIPEQDVAPLDDLVVDDAPEITAASADAETMDGLVGQDFAAHGAEVVPLDDLKTGAGSLTEFDDLERSSELDLTPSDTNEFQVPSAAEELDVGQVADPYADWSASVEPPEDFPVLDADAAPVPPEGIAQDTFETVAGSFGADAPESPASLGAGIELDSADEADWAEEEPASAGLPELVVTESMADLYLRQGHRKEALAVYRLLYQRAPDDLRLRERVDELETEGAAEISAADPAEPADPVVSLAAADSGRTVSTFLGALLRSALPGPAGDWQHAVAPAARSLDQDQGEREPGSAAPTRPAVDHLSLSSVFGDEASPVPPAIPASRGDAAGEVSFDAFFGDGGGSQPRSHAPARDDDDLDEFQTWLQSLKR